MRKRTKKVYGVGVNDADYRFVRYEIINGKRKQVWFCDYYNRWRNMLMRCCSSRYQECYPTYKGCTICKEWLTFSNFKAWMETQDWEGKQLDKDFLVEGNKVYNPETCIFIPAIVNSFTIDSGASRGELPLGVSKRESRYLSQCCDPFKTRSRRVGVFNTPEEAHLSWKARKHQYAVELANSEYVTDERVRQVLLNKYKTI